MSSSLTPPVIWYDGADARLQRLLHPCVCVFVCLCACAHAPQTGLKGALWLLVMVLRVDDADGSCPFVDVCSGGCAPTFLNGPSTCWQRAPSLERSPSPKTAAQMATASNQTLPRQHPRTLHKWQETWWLCAGDACHIQRPAALSAVPEHMSLWTLSMGHIAWVSCGMMHTARCFHSWVGVPAWSSFC